MNPVPDDHSNDVSGVVCEVLFRLDVNALEIELCKGQTEGRRRKKKCVGWDEAT